ncbi:MAG: hypothetical protein AAF772_12920, partial [Acidobacteriota bacterium]
PAGTGIYVERRDAVVDALADTPLARAQAPLILICRDPAAGDVLADWQQLADTLVEPATEGWPGAYAPWGAARAMVVCTSVDLPAAVEASLRAAIEGFFARLPEASRPPLEQVHIVPWGALRRCFDRLPRILDGWLGGERTALVAHETWLAGLMSFQQYLRPDRLPYVAPPTDAAFHPDGLLDRLRASAGRRGVLVGGPGGVGKSRLLTEVGSRAVAQGWRVLHGVSHDDAPLTVGALRAAIFEENAEGVAREEDPPPLLLIFDYLELFESDLDLAALRNQLLPLCRARGVPVALLASARSGLPDSARPDRDALFERLHLRPDADYRDAVARQVRTMVAPLAQARLGARTMARLCGRRPIIALLVAHELEQMLLLADDDAAPDVEMLRRQASGGQGERAGGDLVAWLRRRLSADALRPLAPDAGDPRLRHLGPRPDAPLVAAAGALAASPQPLDTLAAVAGQLLAAAVADDPLTDPIEAGEMLIDALTSMGWLEADGGDLRAAHDVVVDDILGSVLRAPAAPRVRTTVLQLLLDAARAAPVGALRGLTSSLGRFARLLEAADPSTDPTAAPCAESLQAATQAWIVDAVPSLRETLLAADPTRAAHTLGALVGSPLWRAALPQLWPAVMAPWLAQHGERAEARHLLYRSLRRLPSGRSDAAAGAAIAPAALTWLAHQGQQLSASYVLSPLLQRDDLDPDAAQDAIEIAFGWLARHGTDAYAQFVLKALVDRRDLDASAAERAVRAGLRWLKHHPGAVDSRFVLQGLLDRPALGGDRERVVDAALGWLGAHAASSEARFVLKPLIEALSAGERSAAQRRQVFEHSLAWLTRHGDDAEARFVLQVLLQRRDLGVALPTVTAAATAWLGHFPQLPEAGFVLDAGLGRDDLAAADRSWLLDAAFTWLEANAAREDADHVMKQLFAARDLPLWQLRRVTDDAIHWLDLHARHRADASFLLRRCLGNRQLPPPVAKQVVQAALAWLRAHPDNAEAEFVRNALLRRRDLPRWLVVEVASDTLARLLETPSTAEREYTLNSLLPHASKLKPDQRRRLVDDTVRWLEQAPRPRAVARRLLGKVGFSIESGTPTARRCSQLGRQYRVPFTPNRPGGGGRDRGRSGGPRDGGGGARDGRSGDARDGRSGGPRDGRSGGPRDTRAGRRRPKPDADGAP